MTQLIQQVQKLAVVQDKLVSVQEESLSEVKDTMNEVKDIKSRLPINPLLAFSSPSEFGYQLWENCSKKEEIITKEKIQTAIKGAAAIYFLSQHAESSSEQLSTLPLISDDQYKVIINNLRENYLEKELVALLTPYIESVVLSLPYNDIILVNSESIQWIETFGGRSENFQKPDLFECHRSAYKKGKKPVADSDAAINAEKYRSQNNTSSFLFGSCVWSLRESMECIFEAKRKNLSKNEALGEIFPKMINLLKDSIIHQSRKCVLFDSQSLYLLVFTQNGLLSSLHFDWTTPGSFVILLDFLNPDATPPWLRVMRSACINLDVEIVKEDSFLGQGGTGRAFRVQQRVTNHSSDSNNSDTASSSSSSSYKRNCNFFI